MNQLCGAELLKDVVQRNLFPSEEMVISPKEDLLHIRKTSRTKAVPLGKNLIQVLSLE